MTNPNDPAFSPDYRNPNNLNEQHEGLTKREYFAAMAMSGISFWDASVNDPDQAGRVENLARACVAFADELIEELNKPKEVV